ncbi:hypothetical protein [Agarivorans gilvus]|uniref:Uncharacterized protein n=1 Tax=Agarivorans gilvus TaxID=680279 RepID=A0ABQ1HXZ4_9ALTE|nr:hypothetical protein [Agarivorans gilvus]GGA95056.1 hypothetical protein GCM10007414_04770 [Agarivorans gilvus]
MIGFGDIEALFSLRDRYNKWRNSEPRLTNTADRFIHLFQAHGVARAQIPRFFGHGLTIHQVEDNNELLKALDTQILDAAAELFAIKPEWLEGGSDELYELKHFYNHPKKFGVWLDSLLSATNVQRIDGWLLTTSEFNDEYDAAIVMREQIGEFGDEAIYRYHLCETWVYGYWKCRADIAACIAQAWKRNCYVFGQRIPLSVFNRVISLNSVPDSELEQTRIHGKKFYAEDLTTNPDFYASALKNEQFGIDSAIARWLEYYELGMMDSRFGDYGKLFRDFGGR